MTFIFTHLFAAERSHVAFSVSEDVTLPSHLALPPEASSHNTSSVPAVTPQNQTEQNQTGPTQLDPDRTEGEVSKCSIYICLLFGKCSVHKVKLK